MRVKPGVVGHEVEEGGCWYAVGLISASAAARSLPAISCQFVCLSVPFLSPQPFISASHPPLFVFHHHPQTPTSAPAAAVLSAVAFCLLIIFLQSSAVYSFSVPVIEAVFESKSCCSVLLCRPALPALAESLRLLSQIHMRRRFSDRFKMCVV